MEINTGNIALKIQEDLAANTQRMNSPEREVLDTVAEYSLQFNAVQLEVLSNLYVRIVCNPRIQQKEKDNFLKWLEFFKKHKRYNDTMYFLSDTIDSMNYKKIIEAGGGIKTQVIRQQHQ